MTNRQAESKRSPLVDISKAYYESFGCQMNAFDTEVIESLFAGAGIMPVEDPAEADVIIVNTCSVRDHAERRAIGRLNDLSRHKDAILVVCGCMAQRLGDKLFSLVPGASLVVGPDNYYGLPDAVFRCIKERARTSYTRQDPEIAYRLENIRGNRVSRFLAITRGCGNFCSYCIVPYLRGPVRSRTADRIIEEIKLLSGRGAREVTLLGQNVMAYHYETTGFVSLLKRILNETVIERLRFLTTHPRDVDDEIFHLMERDTRLCPHMHLPIQSGSDRILSLMGRGYTGKRYMEIIARAREIKPDLALSTDFIVGFPSESEGEFLETIEMAEKCMFDSAFTFKYSPRDGTVSSRMEDNVPDEVKKERLETLNDSIRRNRQRILEERIGSMDEILLDAEVKKGEYRYWRGRTPHFRNVLVEGDRRNPGDIVRVTLKEMDNYTYIGEEIPRR